MKRKLYQEIALVVVAFNYCIDHKMSEQAKDHENRILSLVENHMPHGSGFDSGTKIVLHRCSDTRLVFSFGYHHMNENGMYDGWTSHEAIIKASLAFGFEIRITGRDRDDAKEYFHQTFEAALSSEYERTPTQST